MVEVKNLRMLIRAKQTGIQNLETIRNNLVMA
jgi:vacuolar-type H+-ATPase subunit C/Vma6